MKTELQKDNIFIGITKEDEVTFIYSNESGLKYLENILASHQLFDEMLTPLDIFHKMSHQLSFGFLVDSFVQINTWQGQNILLKQRDYAIFNDRYMTWKSKMKEFIGEDNLIEVTISLDYIKNLSPEQMSNNEDFFNVIETHRLYQQLNNQLPNSQKKNSSKI